MTEELPPYPFPGPEPDMTDLSQEKVRNAEISLRIALNEKRGITEENAHLLLQQMVRAQRQIFVDKLFGGSIETFSKSSEDLFIQCSTSSFLSGAFLEDLKGVVTPMSTAYLSYKGDEGLLSGIAPKSAFAKMTCEDFIGHAFALVVFPVSDTSGQIAEKCYLVDTTYRQFFSSKESHEFSNDSPKKINLPGQKIIQSERGREVADSLLKNGYIELGDDVASLYFQSFGLPKMNFKGLVNMLTSANNILANGVTPAPQLQIGKDEIPRSPIQALINKGAKHKTTLFPEV